MTGERRIHKRILLTITVCISLLLTGIDPWQAAADSRPLSQSKYTNGAAMRRVFIDVVAPANEWTVRLNADGENVAYGTIVRTDGYIVSKASQLTGKITCRLADGRELPAEYVGYNSRHDVAMLKVDADNLRPVRWGDEDDPGVGSWVITPDQQGAPQSVGVVSVSRRSIPLIKVPAILGIKMVPEQAPVTIESVFEDSAAHRAKLLPGDVIHKVDTVAIVSTNSMKYEISRRAPGDKVTLTIDRGGKELVIRVTLTHPFGEFQSRIAMQNNMGGDLSQRRTGFPAVLQHDSVLEPNECGGPLVNLSGEAIGINIARAGRTETYAIPAAVLRPVITELLTGDYPPPGEQQPTVAAGLSDGEPAEETESDTSRQ